MPACFLRPGGDIHQAAAWPILVANFCDGMYEPTHHDEQHLEAGSTLKMLDFIGAQ